MKVIFVSWLGSGLPLARKLIQEGNDVKAYIKDKYSRDVHDGLVPKISNFLMWADWADAYIFDDVSFGYEQDLLRRTGKKVLGGSSLGDLVELDREVGKVVAQKTKMKIPESWYFDNFDEAIEFVKSERIPLVFKMAGDNDLLKDLVWVSKTEDSSDILRLLEYLKRRWSVFSNAKPSFLLQRRIDGIEVAVGAFHNGKRFMKPLTISFEHKDYRGEGVGVKSGEEGTVVNIRDEFDLFNESLGMLESFFTGNVGYLDINGIYNDEGYWFLEFTARFGYPLLYIQMESIAQSGKDKPFTAFVESVLNGEDEVPMKRGWFTGLVISLPPYPNECPDYYRSHYADMPIVATEKTNAHTYWIDVCQEDGALYSCGSVGYIGTVVGSGETAQDSIRSAYDLTKGIYIPYASWRPDIGVRVTDEVLSKLGLK